MSDTSSAPYPPYKLSYSHASENVHILHFFLNNNIPHFWLDTWNKAYFSQTSVAV